MLQPAVSSIFLILLFLSMASGAQETLENNRISESEASIDTSASTSPTSPAETSSNAPLDPLSPNILKRHQGKKLPAKKQQGTQYKEPKWFKRRIESRGPF